MVTELLYCSIHDVLGQFSIRNISKKITELNKDIKDSQEKWVRSNVENITFIEDDIRELANYHHLRIRHCWLIKRKCINENKKNLPMVLFANESDVIPEQIFGGTADLCLRCLNNGSDKWVISNIGFLFLKNKKELIKLKPGFVWIVKTVILTESLIYCRQSEVMININILIKNKIYKINYG
jgi:hypothetical protein